jgi:hypothetical protein
MIYSYSMFQQPPQQQQNPTNYFPNTDAIGTGITNTMNSVSSSIADTKNSFQNTMNEFSSANVINAGNEFLQSNSLIAKFGFIILVLFGFLFLFKIGMLIISSILSPSDSPYLIKGLISGTESIRVQQDSRTSSAIVNYSENQPTGLEFTYSVWILLNSTNTSNNSNYAHIFNKGIVDGSNITVSGVNNLSNAPGLYVKGNTDGTSTFRVYMDTFSQSGSIQNINDQRIPIDISGVPYNKWVNVIIRTQNRILDVYINGVLTQHKDLGYVPRQNFGDVYVCQNGGFSGKLSDLRYYAKALNVFEINGIVGWGPSLATSASSASQSNTDATYLSHLWYKATQ